jgi:hypothetical protein
MFNTLDVTGTPSSLKDLTSVARNGLFYKHDQRVLARIKYGHPFTMTTHNPERHPLPSYGLLEMQWRRLTRIVSMSAAFEIQEVVEVIVLEEMTSCFRLKSNNVLRWTKASESSGSHMPVPRTP